MAAEPHAPQPLPDAGGVTLSVEDIRQVLRLVLDPDLGMSVVDLGLIYDIRIEPGNKVAVDMTLTTPACPYGPEMVREVQNAVRNTHGVQDCQVNVVWEPVWSLDQVSEEVKLELGIDY